MKDLPARTLSCTPVSSLYEQIFVENSIFTSSALLPARLRDRLPDYMKRAL